MVVVVVDMFVCMYHNLTVPPVVMSVPCTCTLFSPAEKKKQTAETPNPRSEWNSNNLPAPPQTPHLTLTFQPGC